MLPGWFTHASSLCAGAAAGFLLQSHRTSRDEKPENGADNYETLSTQVVRRDNASHSMPMLPRLPIRLFQPNEDLVIAYDTRNKASASTYFYLMPTIPAQM